MADTRPPTDEELNAWIEARLRLIGVDLDQLPESPDPETGSPSRDQALGALRRFLRRSVIPPSDWQPADDPRLQQQVAPPVLYPSPHWARTESGRSER